MRFLALPGMTSKKALWRREGRRMIKIVHRTTYIVHRTTYIVNRTPYIISSSYIPVSPHYAPFAPGGPFFYKLPSLPDLAVSFLRRQLLHGICFALKVEDRREAYTDLALFCKMYFRSGCKKRCFGICLKAVRSCLSVLRA